MCVYHLRLASIPRLRVLRIASYVPRATHLQLDPLPAIGATRITSGPIPKIKGGVVRHVPLVLPVLVNFICQWRRMGFGSIELLQRYIYIYD
jgi:hypothetical protein